MAFPRNMLNSFTPMALRTITTSGAKGPPVALLPMRVTRREEVTEVEVEDGAEVEGWEAPRPGEGRGRACCWVGGCVRESRQGGRSRVGPALPPKKARPRGEKEGVSARAARPGARSTAAARAFF